jgi:regulator of sirC expression with transglutaminase-like and TPR domain
MYDQIMAKNIFPNGGKIGGIKPSNEALDLMKKILKIDQKERLSWEELLFHPAFEDNNELPESYRVTRRVAKILPDKPAEVQDRTDEEYLK